MTTRTSLGLAAIALVLAAVFVVRLPQRPAEKKVFDLLVAAGKVVTGPAVLSVIEGDDVTIRIVSDADEELHGQAPAQVHRG